MQTERPCPRYCLIPPLVRGSATASFPIVTSYSPLTSRNVGFGVGVDLATFPVTPINGAGVGVGVAEIMEPIVTTGRLKLETTTIAPNKLTIIETAAPAINATRC